MNAKRVFSIVGLVLGLALPISARADVNLTVTPLTWNIIGLDSNDPASGPNLFPVGARVCIGSEQRLGVTNNGIGRIPRCRLRLCTQTAILGAAK